MNYSTLPLPDLLDAFASQDPVPGGGSASALAGALGASLLLMVAGMPKTKSGTPEEEADLAAAAARLRPVRETLLALVDRDSAAYEEVMAAFRLPKATDEEKAARRTAIQTATRLATDVPLDTMRACAEALSAADDVERCGNPNAASDVQVARALLQAGLRGAGFNVDINLPALTDEEYVAQVRRERAALGGTTAPRP